MASTICMSTRARYRGWILGVCHCHKQTSACPRNHFDTLCIHGCCLRQTSNDGTPHSPNIVMAVRRRCASKPTIFLCSSLCSIHLPSLSRSRFDVQSRSRDTVHTLEFPLKRQPHAPNPTTLSSKLNPHLSAQLACDKTQPSEGIHGAGPRGFVLVPIKGS